MDDQETSNDQPRDGAITDLDREDVRHAVLESVKLGQYRPGMVTDLLADLKAIKTAS